MTGAINSVLGGYGYKSWATEFPNFTWNNYFMINGTYDTQITNAYTDLATLPPPFTGPEWQLFRSWLTTGRENYQAGNAGVALVDQANFQLPNNLSVDGPPSGKPDTVDHLGAVYIEFYSNNLNLQAGQTADLNLSIWLPNPESADTYCQRVSPICRGARHTFGDKRRWELRCCMECDSG